jgi:YbbR domain-containing protein
MVVGKPELLTPLTHISTAEIPVDNLKADTERQVPLQLPPGVTLKDGRTSVRVIIKVRDTTKINP